MAAMATAEEAKPHASTEEDQAKKKKRKRSRPKKMPKESEPAPSDTANNDEDSTPEEEEAVAEDREEEVAEEREAVESHKEKKKAKKSGSGIMSTEAFSALGLSEPTMKAINDMGFENMTQVCYGKFGLVLRFLMFLLFGCPENLGKWKDKKLKFLKLCSQDLSLFVTRENPIYLSIYIYVCVCVELH